MKAKLTKDECLKITSETAAEYIALSRLVSCSSQWVAGKSSDKRGKYAVWLCGHEDTEPPE